MTDERLMSVYLLRIQGTDYFKVGISADVEQRLAGFRTGMPFDIDLIHSYTQSDALETEQSIHRMLSGMHVRREWFQGEPAEIERIFHIGNTMSMIDAITDDPNLYEAPLPATAPPRAPVAQFVVPTTPVRITGLLASCGEWLTASEISVALNVGLQVIRVEIVNMSRLGDVRRRACEGKDTRERYEYAAPLEEEVPA